MCGNRVEELESQVKELEASVKGLTDELVECKVRLRELEEAYDGDLGYVPDSDDEGEDPPESAAAESNKSPDEAEATKPEGSEGEDKTGESESDIIVA